MTPELWTILRRSTYGFACAHVIYRDRAQAEARAAEFNREELAYWPVTLWVAMPYTEAWQHLECEISRNEQ